MAHLVAVCRVENHQFRRRQLPLVVDDSLTVCVYLRNIMQYVGDTTVLELELEGEKFDDLKERLMGLICWILYVFHSAYIMYS